MSGICDAFKDILGNTRDIPNPILDELRWDKTKITDDIIYYKNEPYTGTLSGTDINNNSARFKAEIKNGIVEGKVELLASDIDFIYPMHLNPNVRKPIHEVFGDDLSNLNNMFFIKSTIINTILARQ